MAKKENIKIYVLIPLYNEEPNIKPLFHELKKGIIDTYPNVHFLFVDDFSTDNTICLLKQFFCDTTFTIITKQANVGPGDSFNIGFRWILEHAKKSDLILTLEADCTSDITILDTMFMLANRGYSIVLASPYAQGGGFSHTVFHRKALSFIGNNLIRFVLGLRVHTLSSFYRIYHVSLIEQIECRYPKIISDNGFFSMIEILCKGVEQEAQVIEVPMVLDSNKRIGKSKMKMIKTSLVYLKFILRYLFLGTKSFR